jgi:hypothetical protein
MLDKDLLDARHAKDEEPTGQELIYELYPDLEAVDSVAQSELDYFEATKVFDVLCEIAEARYKNEINAY